MSLKAKLDSESIETATRYLKRLVMIVILQTAAGALVEKKIRRKCYFGEHFHTHYVERTLHYGKYQATLRNNGGGVEYTCILGI